MEQEQKMGEVKDKIFGKLSGNIIFETLHFESLYNFSFDFRSGKNLHRFNVNDKRVLTKIFQLYGVSFKNTVNELRLSGKRGMDIVDGVTDALKLAISDNNRTVVLLTNDKIEVVSVVSEEHQQLPLTKAFEVVNSIALKRGAKLVTFRETGQSYIVEYEVGQDANMSIRVKAYLGRNDAMGRAGVHFEGSGNIFVCSNMIVPHIDTDIHFKAEGKELLNVKIVHTTNIEKRLKQSLTKSFDSAKHNIGILAKVFEESKSIVMSRVLQKHCVELIRLKKNIPDKWNYQIKRRLRDEDETLYGLSQALTYVASHSAEQDSDISRTLSRLGGQVVLLGRDFVKLVTKSLTDKKIEVPQLVSSS